MWTMRQPPAAQGGQRLTVVLCGLGVLCGCLLACGGGAPGPAALDTRNDACASCRMAVSDARLAAQIVVAGEEPRFFDDLGCLSAYLHGHGVAAEAAVFVADHRTGEWIDARSAVFTRVDAIETPMGSHIVAHADARSRNEDLSARSGRPVTANDILGPRP